MATTANTAFHISHPGLAIVAKTMTTGTLDAAPPPASSSATAGPSDPVIPVPTEWAEEHFIVEQLMKDAGWQNSALASRIDTGVAPEVLEPVTDTRHADEFYPGAYDYNLDIDDYCISRGGFDASEDERIALEMFHQRRLEEDRINMEQRSRARAAMELARTLAIIARERSDRLRAEERARGRGNPFDSELAEWETREWPNEQPHQ